MPDPEYALSALCIWPGEKHEHLGSVRQLSLSLALFVSIGRYKVRGMRSIEMVYSRFQLGEGRYYTTNWYIRLFKAIQSIIII